MRSRLLLLAPAAALALAACDAETTTPPAAGGGDEIGSVVPAGKADDFFSTSAQEYYVEATIPITVGAALLDATPEEQLAEVKRLIPLKQVWLGWFLKELLVDKDTSHGEAEYGGYKALTKNGSYEELGIRPAEGQPGTWLVDVRQEVGGQNDLLQAIDGATSEDGRVYTFELKLGVVDNATLAQLETNHEWYRKSPWSGFDPSKLSAAQVTTLPIRIQAEPRSEDAWLDTNRLFEDGKVSIGVHFGWDYHSAYHEKHSKAVYDFLTGRGFKSPVGKWEDLRHDAGPLTGKVKYGAREVAVEVSLFWGRAGDPATDPDTDAGGKQLEADMLESLETREVVVFSGHSGPFYGFALANWRKTDEGDLDDSELATVPLNEGVYQLILAEGCDTYAIGQAFYDNPYKAGLTDLDVITTTSFSNASTASTVLDTLKALLGADARTAKPTKWSQLMRDLDSNSTWFSTMYGVHGIDDAPTVHPFADLAKTCGPCTRHSDCGDGMQCVAMADGEKVCAANCTASRDCGEGRACRNVQTGGWLGEMACVPEGLSCKTATVDEGPRVIVNEVLADPADGAAGDANGDGARDASADEFVELVNVGAGEVDLSGFTLSDAVMVRHVFPAGTVLPPGGAIVVFGGGTVALQAGTTVFQTATRGALGLNNAGDVVKVADLDGNAIAEAAWGKEGGKDLAMTRLVDGDAGAGWTTATPSPGTHLDGSQF